MLSRTPLAAIGAEWWRGRHQKPVGGVFQRKGRKRKAPSALLRCTVNVSPCSPSRGKEVTRYTFKVTNYEGHEGTVYANVLVWRKKVIGGDICSAEITNGFVQGFEKK